MNEKRMKRRLRILAGFSIVITVFIFVAGFAGMRVFMTTFNQTMKETMSREAENYKGRIQRQIENNFQTLNTLASFIEMTEFDQKEEFEEALAKADAKNDFLLFGYFNLEGEGVFTSNEGYIHVTLSNVSEEIRHVVETTFQGEKSVSDAFMGDVSMQSVFVYGVPVYQNGKVTGSLVASDSVDAFSEEVGNKEVIGNRGYMHLIDSDGNYIIHRDESVVKEKVDTIFGAPYMSEAEAEEMKQHLKRNEVQKFSFVYENVEYNARLEPLGINGWYLFCINSMKNANTSTYSIAYASGIFFSIITALFFFILLYGYREMKQNNRELRELAYYDELTGIYNFRYFKEYCEYAVKEKKKYAIASLNVKQFKFINEIFGNYQADRLLCFIGRILQNSTFEGECVCRESADYFYLFLLDTDKDILERRMQIIIDRITKAEDVERSGYRFFMHCGIALSEEGKSIDDIMTYAMFAMAKAKEVPHKSIWLFDTALHEQEQLRNNIENNAHDALKNGEFKLYLQPKVELEEDVLCGAEALVRWEEKNGNILYPGAFIPLFEENGFCAELDMYMFEKVCKKLREWMDQGMTPINISINQSRITFYKENYIEDLCDILEKYDVSASYITLEILEGLFLKDVDEMTQRLRRLKEIGFRISMDDFGTGYSSLNMLGKLEIDEVKLDRSFLNEAVEETNKNTRVIMEEMIRLSHELSISIVIEGIETLQQDRFVKEIGCEYGQGFFYGKPIHADRFTKNFIEKI